MSMRILPCLVLACVAVAGLVMVTSSQASAGRLIATEAFPLPQGFHEVQWDAVPRAPRSFVAARNQDPNRLGEITAIFTWENATQSWRSFRPGVPAMINTLHHLQTGEVYWFAVGPIGAARVLPPADEEGALTNHLAALSWLSNLSDVVIAQAEEVSSIFQTLPDGTITAAGSGWGQRWIDAADTTWESGSDLLAEDAFDSLAEEGFGETVAASCTEALQTIGRSVQHLAQAMRWVGIALLMNPDLVFRWSADATHNHFIPEPFFTWSTDAMHSYAAVLSQGLEEIEHCAAQGLLSTN